MKKLLLGLAFLSYGALVCAESWSIKDGSTIVGSLVKESEQDLSVQTSYGLVTIKKTDLLPLTIQLDLIDGNVLKGILLKEDKDSFKVKTSVGEIEILKKQVRRFEKNITKSDVKKEDADSKNLSFSERLIESGEKESLNSGYQNTIEPLIDIFFDPTGNVLKKNEIYLSGLSLAYGVSDYALVSFKVLDFIGLNRSKEFNPNLEFKANVYANKDSIGEYNISTGVRLDALSLIGMREYGTDNNLRPWAQEKYQKTSDAFSRYQGYHEIVGWKAQAYVAQTWTKYLERGGAMNIHLGGNIEVNQTITKVNWSKRPSYRVYTGIDFDVSRKLKVLGEIFYDPDYWNWITSEPNVGADFGVMYALTDSFRFMIHAQPYIIGFYWRV